VSDPADWTGVGLVCGRGVVTFGGLEELELAFQNESESLRGSQWITVVDISTLDLMRTRVALDVLVAVGSVVDV
jgi:hypothetical protein